MMPAPRDRLDSVRKVLGAVKRSEMAQLKGRLHEAATARADAAALRAASAREPDMLAVTDMMFQSRHQLRLEHSAREQEDRARAAELEARAIRSALAITLGREEAARLLAEHASRKQRIIAERRAETVPTRTRNYASSPGGSSAGTA